MKNGWAQLLRSKRGTTGVVTRSVNSDFRLFQQTAFWLRDLELGGTCAITTDASATLTRLRDLTGSCAIAVGASGDVVRVRALAGTCALSTDFTGAAVRVRSLTGSCAITTGLTGTLSVYTGPIYRELSATVAIRSGFDGSLTRVRSLTATCPIILTPALGTLQRIRVRQVIPLTVAAPSANSLATCAGATPATTVASPVTQPLAGLPL